MQINMTPHSCMRKLINLFICIHTFLALSLAGDHCSQYANLPVQVSARLGRRETKEEDKIKIPEIRALIRLHFMQMRSVPSTKITVLECHSRSSDVPRILLDRQCPPRRRRRRRRRPANFPSPREKRERERKYAN